jgi:type IV pilus assembly protein PilE
MDATRTARPRAVGRRSRWLPWIEVIASAAVVAIVLSAAVPGYREHLRRGGAQRVTETLGAGRVVAEQYFLDQRTYVGAPCPRATDDFVFRCDLHALRYKLIATGRGVMNGFVYTLDDTGERTTTGPWGSGTCWIAREGDTC